MKRLIVSAVAVCAALAAFGIAASQAWTESRIAELRAELEGKIKVVQQGMETAHATTNGVAVTTYSYGEGANRVTLVSEDATVYSLQAANATPAAVAQGVTNGMFFVWDGASHSYTNHAQAIEASPSNFVWNAVQSVGGSFPELFDVVGVMLQPSYAEEVTK